MNQVLLLKIHNFSNYMTKTWCVGGSHLSETKNRNVYEKVNPKTNKIDVLVELIDVLVVIVDVINHKFLLGK